MKRKITTLTFCIMLFALYAAVDAQPPLRGLRHFNFVENSNTQDRRFKVEYLLV